MPYHYQPDAPRLLRENVSPGQFGGFLTWDRESMRETLYAVDRETGKAVMRSDWIGCKEFDGSGWEPCEAVPGHAEWIGNYPAPKARAVMDGTRIVLKGQVGGFQ